MADGNVWDTCSKDSIRAHYQAAAVVWVRLRGDTLWEVPRGDSYVYTNKILVGLKNGKFLFDERSIYE